MADHNELGKAGEDLAVKYLTQKGYQILRRNFRFKKEEIDIICKQNDMLVIVEVKTRHSDYLAGPEVTVTKRKQRAIIKVANHYILEENLDIETRFDIISIILNEKTKEIEHLEDAFYPTL